LLLSFRTAADAFGVSLAVARVLVADIGRLPRQSSGLGTVSRLALPTLRAFAMLPVSSPFAPWTS